MGSKRYLHSVLIMTVFTMIISISAVCAMAESSVDITQPDDGSTVKPGYVEVWTRFAQPPNMGDIAITEGQASYINSHYGVSYSPVHYKIYKDGNLFREQDVNQAKLNFTTSGSKSTTFLFEDEGTYDIQASVPQTSGEYSSVTINVAGEYDGVDYSNSAFDSTDSDTITEGVPVRTTLTPDNYFSTTYKLTPAKSGWYVFFSSGYTKRIRATLYEGVGGKSSVKRVTSSNGDSGQFGLSAELTAGTTYTLHIEGYVRKTETVFDVGFFSKESGVMMASASEITLTDPNRTYRFGVCQGTTIPESAHWVIEDDSIVGSDSSSSFSRGTPEYDTYYNGATITLNARKNGSTTVRYVDGDVTYATCKIICKDIPENSGSDDQGGSDNQKSDDSSKQDSDGQSSEGQQGGDDQKPDSQAPDGSVHQHKFSEWTTTKDATEIAAGVQTRTCSVCGETDTQEIAQLAPTLKAVKILKPKAAKKSATIKWKKVTKTNLKKIKKIEIQYSTDKNFNKTVKTKYASAKKTSYKIKGLKKGKKYYVRIRAYTESGGKVHVSKWSAKKSFKAK